MRPSVWGNNIITVRYIAVHGSVGRPSSGREEVTRVKRTDVELRTGREGGGGRSGGDLTRYFLLPGHCSLHATGLLSMVLSKYLLLLWVWRTSQGAGIFYFIKDKSIYVVYILLYSVVPNDMTWQKNKNKNILENYPIYRESGRVIKDHSSGNKIIIKY